MPARCAGFRGGHGGCCSRGAQGQISPSLSRFRSGEPGRRRPRMHERMNESSLGGKIRAFVPPFVVGPRPGGRPARRKHTRSAANRAAAASLSAHPWRIRGRPVPRCPARVPHACWVSREPRRRGEPIRASVAHPWSARAPVPGPRAACVLGQPQTAPPRRAYPRIRGVSVVGPCPGMKGTPGLWARFTVFLGATVLSIVGSVDVWTTIRPDNNRQGRSIEL